jgi:pimeloyl-ACP methyl ester carboxylesterase
MSHSLNVPGASLHYQVGGSGPVLLMIPGGAMDADGFGPIAPILAERYTVVTYDPRGLSRSRLDGPFEGDLIQVYADDASRLLEAVSSEPAYVFGSSGGAQVGFELVTRRGDQVKTFVAHEPPAEALLPEERQFARSTYDVYKRGGVGPAMQKFVVAIGMENEMPPPPQGELTPEMRAAMARMQSNVVFFLDHMMLTIPTYVPDVAALRAAPTRVVVGVGERSAGQLAHDTGVAMAELIGTEPVPFPGGHGGFMEDPGAFADRLHEVLQGQPYASASRNSSPLSSSKANSSA